MADAPVQNTSQTAPQEPAAVASASPTPQEPAVQQATATPPAEPAAVSATASAPADSSASALPPAADVKATPETPAADSPQLTLLQEFDKDAKAKDTTKDTTKEKPAAETKPAEPAKDAKPAADAKPADKPAEAPKPEDAAKPADAKPVEPAPLTAIEYKYDLPKTLKMDDALKGEVHTALDAFRVDPAKGVQKLIDLHAKTMETYAAETEKRLL